LFHTHTHLSIHAVLQNMYHQKCSTKAEHPDNILVMSRKLWGPILVPQLHFKR